MSHTDLELRPTGLNRFHLHVQPVEHYSMCVFGLRANWFPRLYLWHVTLSAPYSWAPGSSSLRPYASYSILSFLQGLAIPPRINVLLYIIVNLLVTAPVCICTGITFQLMDIRSQNKHNQYLLENIKIWTLICIKIDNTYYSWVECTLWSIII